MPPASIQNATSAYFRFIRCKDIEEWDSDFCQAFPGTVTPVSNAYLVFDCLPKGMLFSLHPLIQLTK